MMTPKAHITSSCHVLPCRGRRYKCKFLHEINEINNMTNDIFCIYIFLFFFSCITKITTKIIMDEEKDACHVNHLHL